MRVGKSRKRRYKMEIRDVPGSVTLAISMLGSHSMFLLLFFRILVYNSFVETKTENENRIVYGLRIAT